jgi:hypothetical protein
MASVKFEEAVALNRGGRTTSRRDHHKHNGGGVDHRVLHHGSRWARREILVPD